MVQIAVLENISWGTCVNNPIQMVSPAKQQKRREEAFGGRIKGFHFLSFLACTTQSATQMWDVWKDKLKS